MEVKCLKMLPGKPRAVVQFIPYIGTSNWKCLSAKREKCEANVHICPK